ncbi:MAG: carboxylate-amine ligase, YbdK family [Mycobacterium sp.]|nr:carboxylate-amine ligase, YbdK family [Mycobacterium sp.]
MSGRAAPTMGVEEEYFLVDAGSGALEPGGARVVARAAPRLGDLVSCEFTQYQIEVKTSPCADAARLREELLWLRALPLLVALSANSPIHRGQDTGYADWRNVIRSRFPCLGPPPYAESLRQHAEIAAAIAESEAMLDAGMPFWDIRPNPRLPTIEIRAMDVPADVDDTLALAVLIRALVSTAAARVLSGDPGPRRCGEVLRAAHWRAARDGWSRPRQSRAGGARGHRPGDSVSAASRCVRRRGRTPTCLRLASRPTRRRGGRSCRPHDGPAVPCTELISTGRR